ncbi:MAG: FAD binding domain-containing protein [Candidatus Neomarinimicrobiota bacterium]|jgi:CO/xanthine dehydrogenase FAD-binding subunit
MLENIKEWFRPESIAETIEIIKSGNAIPYAGGTGSRSARALGLIDLRRLNLDYIREENDWVAIGAGTSFNKIANYQWSDSRHILALALGQAASNPLRNLITIGGSLAFRPAWSNVPTPLLALGASVKVAGAPATEYPIADFLHLKRNSKFFITEVKVPPAPGYGVYHRFARTRFDYAALDLAVYIAIRSDTIEICRIAVGNLIPVARRLTELEKNLTGLKISDSGISEILKAVDLKPLKNSNFSREFLLNMLKTELVRAFTQIREQIYAN